MTTRNEVVDRLLGNIDGAMSKITHPHGRRAHHIDSRDEAILEALKELRENVEALRERAEGRSDE